jgi:hypothetical protein
VYMELLLGHEKIITKSGISLNAGTLNRGFTVYTGHMTILRLAIVIVTCYSRASFITHFFILTPTYLKRFLFGGRIYDS